MNVLTKKILNFIGLVFEEATRTIHAYTSSNMGLVRKTNEDNFFTGCYSPTIEALKDSKNINLNYKYSKKNYASECFAIFDGMGGMNAGEVASSLAASHLCKEILNLGKISNIHEYIDFIQRYTGEISNYIYKESLENLNYEGMGTTFTCLCIHNNSAVALNVGDSRCYNYVDGKLIQLTTDHNIASENYKNGKITLEEYKKSPDTNKITRFLGMSTQHGIMVCSVSDIIEINKDMRFLLCSDGLYGYVEEMEIIEGLNNTSCSKCAEKLIKLAVKNGAPDNVTVTVVDVLKMAK